MGQGLVAGASTGSYRTFEWLRGTPGRHSPLLKTIESVELEVRELAQFGVGGCFEKHDHALDVLGPRCDSHRLSLSLTYLTKWRTRFGFCVAKVSRDRTLRPELCPYLGEVGVKH